MTKLLTAKQLNILPWERAGLIRFVKESKQLRHYQPNETPPSNGERAFNLSIPAVKYAECGTAGCIGGFVAFYRGMDVNDAQVYVLRFGVNYGGHSRALHDLYLPGTFELEEDGHRGGYLGVEPDFAGKVVLHFLRTGEITYKKSIIIDEPPLRGTK